MLIIYIAALTWAFCGTLRLLPLDFKYREPIAFLTTVLSVFLLVGGYALIAKLIAGTNIITILLETFGLPLIIFAMPFFMAKIVKDW